MIMMFIILFMIFVCLFFNQSYVRFTDTLRDSKRVSRTLGYPATHRIRPSWIAIFRATQISSA